MTDSAGDAASSQKKKREKPPPTRRSQRACVQEAAERTATGGGGENGRGGGNGTGATTLATLDSDQEFEELLVEGEDGDATDDDGEQKLPSTPSSMREPHSYTSSFKYNEDAARALKLTTAGRRVVPAHVALSAAVPRGFLRRAARRAGRAALAPGVTYPRAHEAPLRLPFKWAWRARVLRCKTGSQLHLHVSALGHYWLPIATALSFPSLPSLFFSL